MLLSLGGAGAVRAQGNKYLTRTGRVTFFSASPIEDIEARNEEAAAAIDLGAAQLAFPIPVRGVLFKRTLMQEHFNENYMESEKFPKSRPRLPAALHQRPRHDRVKLHHPDDR